MFKSLEQRVEEGQMETFTGTKVIKAISTTRAEYCAYRGWDLPSDEDGDEEIMLVEYPVDPQSKPNHENHRGYISMSPKHVFEKAYRKNGKLDFGAALYALKEGKKVSRSGWNGKGMYLWLLPAAEVKKEWVKDPLLLEAFEDKDVLECSGSIRMKTATGEVLTGWLASQTDMLSEDWCIVN